MVLESNGTAPTTVLASAPGSPLLNFSITTSPNFPSSLRRGTLPALTNRGDLILSVWIFSHSMTRFNYFPVLNTKSKLLFYYSLVSILWLPNMRVFPNEAILQFSEVTTGCPTS